MAAALFPAIALGVYIYIKDKAEKEPFWLLLVLFVLGAVTVFPAAFLEGLHSDMLFDLFSPLIQQIDGANMLEPFWFYVYTALDNFVGVALIEEGLKWIVLLLVTRRSKHFNSLFDGVIYAVFVSLGFAALENLLYVGEYGWTTALLRMVTAVPGHMFDGVFMGLFYSSWKIHSIAGEYERILPADYPRVGKPFSGKGYLACSLIVPIILHGFYDYTCSIGDTASVITFYVFLGILYITAFSWVRKMSKIDAATSIHGLVLLFERYPEVRDLVMEKLRNDANMH